MCYTTKVSVDKTVAEIIRLLKFTAKALLLENDEKTGDPVAVSFELITPQGRLRFKLPVDHLAVGQALRRQADSGELAGISYGRVIDPDHARRVAWRINLEWLKVQLALIDSGQVKMEQIFLPYMLVDGERTVYQMLEDRQFKALPAPNPTA